MWARYNAFLLAPAEVTVSWNDRQTGARGWLVINSFRGGAAGGGTRMRPGGNPAEAAYLAKTMELKFALAGPSIGGAKSVLDFDPSDPRKAQVLQRWFTAISPYLRDRYGTGGDLNVDEVTEVLPLLQSLGLEHPQAGVVRGHFCPAPEGFSRILNCLNRGVKAPVNGAFGINGQSRTVASMITGYGLARAIARYYDQLGLSLDGARVLLEGFGNVGAAAGLYLARAGAVLVGISDAEKALIEPRGMAADEVERLICQGPPRLLPPDRRCVADPTHDALFGIPADLFVCAAASGTLDQRRLGGLAAAGVQVVAAGANQPFREDRPGSTRVHQAADARFAVLTDFLANLGGARTFSYLMQDDADPAAEGVFQAVERTITTGVDETLSRAERPDRGLMAATLGLALDRIGAP
jgi:glutamate dehydrogenase/leucine dehydrogenase